MAAGALPEQMQALVLSAYGPAPFRLRVESHPLPRPGPGEVLVRVAASPVNPSDLMFLEGRYAFKKELPAIPGIEAHEWHAAVFPTSTISHKGQVAGAKVLAASIIDLLTSPELLQKARAEFQEESKKTPYFSLLPPEAKPDTGMNRVEMEKYRAEMRKFYLNKTPRFN